MSARRGLFETLEPEAHTHAGLWLDRFLKASPIARTTSDPADAAAGLKAELVQQISGLQAGHGYFEAARLRQREAEHLRDSRRGLFAEASASGRLILGLGSKGPVEAGLHLDHTWGVPTLPGSALKGLCSTTAHLLLQDDSWRKRSENTVAGSRHEHLFGALEQVGRVIFHDAWWVPPRPLAPLPLRPDVTLSANMNETPPPKSLLSRARW